MSFRFIPILALSLLAFTSITRGDEIEEKKRQLDAVKAELDSKRDLYDSLGQKEKTEQSRLREIEEQVALSNQLMLKIKRESSRLEKDISSQRLQLEITNLRRSDREEVLKRRLRHIYKAGFSPLWMEVLSSGNPTEALSALRNMRSLLEYDNRLMTEFSELTSKLETGLKKYQADRQTLGELEKAKSSELSQREKTMKTRKKIVDRLKKDKTEVQQSISRLQEDAKEISGIIEDLELEAMRLPADSTLAGLERSKGNLIWPVQGKIIRKFGLIQDKRGLELSNPGIDIQAKFGDNVLAASSGMVIYSSWLRGYGQFIIIDHGKGYYTLYSHLSDVFVDVGERVKAAEIIGAVGDSGSLEGSKLHFEVRHKKEQLDPEEWLR